MSAPVLMDWLDRPLDLPGYQARKVPGAGVDLNLVAGVGDDRPPLLLLPGLNDPWFSYGPVLAPLSRHFSVYVPDWRGHGPSDRDPGGGYQVRHYAMDAAAVLERQIGRPTIVAGNSLGALVAAHLAAELPDLVCGAVLEDGPFFITEPSRWAGHPLREKLFGPVTALLGRRDGGELDEDGFVAAYGERIWGYAVSDRFEDRLVHLGKLMVHLRPLIEPLPAADQARLRAGMLGFVRGGDVAWRDLLPPPLLSDAARIAWRLDTACPAGALAADFSQGIDHGADLAAIRCPVLVLEADRDLVGLLSAADIDHLMGSLGRTRAEHLLVEGGLHAIHASRPDIYLRAVMSMFARPENGRP